MLKRIKLLHLIWIPVVLFVISHITMASSQVKNYNFDPDHTFVIWRVSHFGYSDITGKFIAEGTLVFDDKNPLKSKATLTIRIPSIATGIKKLDDTLQGRSFFNTEEYPTATFVSEKITEIGNKTGKVEGKLTVKGITKPIVLNVKLNKSGKHPFFAREGMGFSGTAQLKRSDFGIRGYLPGVADKVDLEIQAEAIVEKPKIPEAENTSDKKPN